MENVATGELFYGWKWHRESIRKFREAVALSGANPESLLHLALEHWSHSPIPDTVATLHFGMVVHTLSSFAGGRRLFLLKNELAFISIISQLNES